MLLLKAPWGDPCKESKGTARGNCCQRRGDPGPKPPGSRGRLYLLQCVSVARILSEGLLEEFGEEERI